MPDTISENTPTETESVTKNTIETHTKKQKESIVKTIKNIIWLWVEELGNAIWGEGTKEPAKDHKQYQIDQELEKAEERQIKKRSIHED